MACTLSKNVCPFCGAVCLYCKDHTPIGERSNALDQHLDEHVQEMIDS